MKFADFVILAIIFIAIVIALWYNHKSRKNGCYGDCNRCSRICGNKITEKRVSKNEH